MILLLFGIILIDCRQFNAIKVNIRDVWLISLCMFCSHFMESNLDPTHSSQNRLSSFIAHCSLSICVCVLNVIHGNILPLMEQCVQSMWFVKWSYPAFVTVKTIIEIMNLIECM